MKLTAKQYAQALHDALVETAPKDQDKVLDNFVEVLGRHNDFKLFEAISEELHKFQLKDKGQTLVNVTTAEPLSPASEKELIHELNRIVSGKVELKKQIDERLIGGVVVQVDDTVIDGSIKRNLEDLKNNIAD